MNVSSIDRSSKMPQSFLDLLEEMNQQKEADTPVALLFETKYDINGVLSSPAAQFQYYQIAQHCRVTTKVISSLKEMNAYLESHPQAEFTIITAHGIPYRSGKYVNRTICLKESPTLCQSYAENLRGNMNHNKINQKLTNKPLYFLTCGAAQFAKNLSRNHGAQVWGAVQDLVAKDTSFSYCKQHNRLEMKTFNWGKQHAYLFNHGKLEGTSCSKQTVGETRTNYINFLKLLDPQTLTTRDLLDITFTNSFYYHTALPIPGIPQKYYEQLIPKLRAESDAGDQISNFYYGHLFLSGYGVDQSYEKAVECFKASDPELTIIGLNRTLDALTEECSKRAILESVDVRFETDLTNEVEYLTKASQGLPLETNWDQALKHLEANPPQIDEARRYFRMLNRERKTLGLLAIARIRMSQLKVYEPAIQQYNKTQKLNKPS